MSYVNSEGYSLSQLCERGVFGRACTAKDYRAWRKIAVAQRATLVRAKLIAGSELTKLSADWLKQWIDLDAYSEDPLEEAVDLNKVLRFADPDDLEHPRYPPDPSIFSLDLVGSPFTYTEVTVALSKYIERGKYILARAEAQDALTTIDPLLAEAEDRNPSGRDWVPWAVWGGVAVGLLAAIGYGVNLWAKITQTRRK